MPALLGVMSKMLGSSTPKVVNAQGGDLLMAESRFEVLDSAKVLARLRESEYEESEQGVFRFFNSSGSVSARIEVSRDKLVVFAKSRIGIDSVKAWLQDVLSNVLRHRLDSFEDPMSSGASASEPPELQPVPPQAQAALRKMLEQHLRQWVDMPIPALGGKSPRQTARSKTGRSQVEAMLREQERMRSDHPQLDEPLDFGPIWSELGFTRNK